MVRQAGLELTAETAQFVKKIREASKAAASLSKRFDRVKPSSKGFASSTKMATGKLVAMAAAGLGAIRSIQGLSGAFQQAAADIDRMGKTSIRLGIMVKDLAALQLQARLGGLSVNTMEMALQRMTRRTAEAAVGTGEAQKAIAEFGLDAKTLAKLNPAEQFAMITDKLRGVENAGDRVRLAMRFFDSEGVAVLQTLGLSLDQARAEAERFGTALNSVEVERVEEMNNAFIRTQEAVRGLSRQITTDLAPLIEDNVSRLESFAAGIRMVIRGFQGLPGLFLRSVNFGLSVISTGSAAISSFYAKVVGAIKKIVVDAAIVIESFLSRLRPAFGPDLIPSFDGTEAKKFADTLERALRPGFTKFNTVLGATAAKLRAQGNWFEVSNVKWRMLAEDISEEGEKAKGTLDGTALAAKKLAGALDDPSTGADTLEDKLRRAREEAKRLAKEVEMRLERAMESFASRAGAALGSFFANMQSGTKSSSEAMKDLTKQIIAAGIAAAGLALGGPLGGFIGSVGGSLVTGLEFAKGGVLKAAKGTVIDSPTIVGSNPTTIGGEAGPEGVLPLERMQNGDLGVQASLNLTMNISTPDADSFRRSTYQVAGDMNRAIAGVFPGLGG